MYKADYYLLDAKGISRAKEYIIQSVSLSDISHCNVTIVS